MPIEKAPSILELEIVKSSRQNLKEAKFLGLMWKTL